MLVPDDQVGTPESYSTRLPSSCMMSEWRPLGEVSCSPGLRRSPEDRVFCGACVLLVVNAVTRPVVSTTAYPLGVVEMPTTRCAEPDDPRDPANPAPPKANTPPSAAASQYPRPSGEAAIAVTGAFSRVLASDPANVASP